MDVTPFSNCLLKSPFAISFSFSNQFAIKQQSPGRLNYFDIRFYALSSLMSDLCLFVLLHRHCPVFSMSNADEDCWQRMTYIILQDEWVNEPMLVALLLQSIITCLWQSWGAIMCTIHQSQIVLKQPIPFPKFCDLALADTHSSLKWHALLRAFTACKPFLQNSLFSGSVCMCIEGWAGILRMEFLIPFQQIV